MQLYPIWKHNIKTVCGKMQLYPIWKHNIKQHVEKCAGTPMLTNCSIIFKNALVPPCPILLRKWQTSFIDKCPPHGSCPNKSPPPPSKSLDAKAPGWGQIFGANPGVRRGMVMDEIDICIKINACCLTLAIFCFVLLS